MQVITPWPAFSCFTATDVSDTLLHMRVPRPSVGRRRITRPATHHAPCHLAPPWQVLVTLLPDISDRLLTLQPAILAQLCTEVDGLANKIVSSASALTQQLR